MIGLVLACLGSVINVLTDVSRKKVLDHHFDPVIIAFWCKAVALACYAVALGIMAIRGVDIALPPVGTSLNLSPKVAFAVYLSLNGILEGTAIFLSYLALQSSPLSLCVPFMALSPVFLLPIGRLFLHEQISIGMVIGVGLVVAGSLVINRRLVANGWMEPARAIFREKGSRYMLLVALLLALTAALDKRFITIGGEAGLSVSLSRAFTISLGKCIVLLVLFGGFTWANARRAKVEASATSESPNRTLQLWEAWRLVPTWLVLAGIFEATVLILQLTAVQFAVAAVVISIKRSGILLACVLGWFLFNERGIVDRVIGSFVMIAGVAIFFVTRPDAAGYSLIGPGGAALVALGSLVLTWVALHLTRDWK